MKKTLTLNTAEACRKGEIHIMDISKFAQEIHRNAVEHGFWEGERDLGEIIALIHSEWSEALEEYRADRPMVWYACADEAHKHDRCDCIPSCYTKKIGESSDSCEYRNPKPEGIAIELIDGCIRILDYIAWLGMSISNIDTLDKLMDFAPDELYNIGLPTLVARLHWYTSEAYTWERGAPVELSQAQEQASYLIEALGIASAWIRKEGYAPEELMATKHSYNKSRPYKHGKVI